MRRVALLTPTHRADIERFDLLCESIDRRVSGYDRHYVIVNDEDMSLFGRYGTERRVVQPASKFLPAWLWAMPRFLSRNGRRVWLSLLSGPIHGWHVQQLLKIGGTLAAAEDRVCIVDSDNLFFRDFDVRAYAGREQTPLYIDAKSIESTNPNHATWTQNAHQLLGLPEPTFPADDYVGNLIVWDKATLKAMTEQIRLVNGQDWRACPLPPKTVLRISAVRRLCRPCPRLSRSPSHRRREPRLRALGNGSTQRSRRALDDRKRGSAKSRLVHPVILWDDCAGDPIGCLERPGGVMHDAAHEDNQKGKIGAALSASCPDLFRASTPLCSQCN